MYFDTHAHYDDIKYDLDRDKVIQSAFDNDVDLIVNVGADIKSSYESVKLAEKYEKIYATVGIHPHEADSLTADTIAQLKELASNKKVVAIGEIGLDYFRFEGDKEVQKRAFVQQIELAKQLNLPVVIHNRDAHEDTMKIIRENDLKNIGGVVHCYSGNVEMAREIIKNNLYISFGGVLTFKNAKKACEVAKNIPLERLLLETDCPYMSPEPHRGERNTSEYLKYVVLKLSELLGKEPDYIAKITADNGKKLYKI